MTDQDAMLRQWEAHTAAEFVARDVDATMRTMNDNPTVLHVPTGMGGAGLDAVRSFYATWFVGRAPADIAIQSISQTAGETTIVDEMLVSFTHDTEVPFILPGVPPTGKRVIIPAVAIVGFEGTAVSSEHIYWDQAAVLAQVGLLDAALVSRLPVISAQHELLDGSRPANELTRPR